jgi:hypothetical protein
MAVMTAERLGATVGALVEGIDGEQLATDDAVAGWRLEALEASGVLLFRGLDLDDAIRRACPCDPDSPRDMHRTTFVGNEPIQ